MCGSSIGGFVTKQVIGFRPSYVNTRRASPRRGCASDVLYAADRDRRPDTDDGSGQCGVESVSSSGKGCGIGCRTGGVPLLMDARVAVVGELFETARFAGDESLQVGLNPRCEAVRDLSNADDERIKCLLESRWRLAKTRPTLVVSASRGHRPARTRRRLTKCSSRRSRADMRQL